jgi:hypothetical protein
MAAIKIEAKPAKNVAKLLVGEAEVYVIEDCGNPLDAGLFDGPTPAGKRS